MPKNDILKLTERLVWVSDFSQGKTAKIFDSVKENNEEYIVLKNNRPSAVILSVDSYAQLVSKAEKMERLLEFIEEIRLLKEAKMISEKYDPQKAISTEDILAELDISQKEIDELEESVVIE